MNRSIVVFDGYRSQLDPGSDPVQSLMTATGSSGPVHRNFRSGPDDSLGSRFHRFVSWLDSGPLGVHQSLHFLAISMGCQVAVRSATHLAATNRLVGIDLIAPDPKFRRCALDRVEAERGERPAFDEARELWIADAAGPPFTTALDEIARHVPCRVVYSIDDEVAEWPANVELLRTDLADTDGITWIEAEPGRTVRDNGITVSVQQGDAIHESLASSVSFG